MAARRSAPASASPSDSSAAARSRAAAGGVPLPGTPFTRRVVAIVRTIPRGRVATYGDVALLAGRPGAARAVGNVMRHCEDPSIPCHRVIGATGALGGYTDPMRKKQHLAAEGVTFSGRRVRRFEELRWSGEGAATPRRRPPV